ncbi:hypothetical protein ACWD7C_30090 [Streptomyces sp. NPDC005134]|uniref:hypothetical protein n=1 Tax=Streptomyces sp. NPDC005098 TaxID=3154560 RepID=UPI0033B9CF57
MRNPTNPEEIAALATVPEIARTQKLYEDAKERLRKHRAGEEPTAARDRVIADSVDAFTASGKWPADVGAKAAKAYVDALEWDAERLALKRAVDLSEDLAHDTRELLSDDALQQRRHAGHGTSGRRPGKPPRGPGRTWPGAQHHRGEPRVGW